MSRGVERVNLSTLAPGQVIRVGADSGLSYFHLRAINPADGQLAFHLSNYPICSVTLGSRVLKIHDTFIIPLRCPGTGKIIDVSRRVSTLRLLAPGEVVQLPGHHRQFGDIVQVPYTDSPYLTI